MKIVFLDAYTTNPGDLSWEELQKLGEVSFFDRTPQDLIVARAIEAEVLITNKCKITGEIIQKLPALRLICEAATGYDNIDIKAARSQGVKVANVAGYSTESVVQHVFAMLLSHLNRPTYYQEGVCNNRWSRSSDFAYWDNPIPSLSGKTIGIVGYGTIGQAVARVALAFGMEVLATSRSRQAGEEGAVRFGPLRQVLNSSHIVSLHMAANQDTIGMVNASFLSAMRSDAILINTARGAIINDTDLEKWLRLHPDAFALLDVLHQEPPTADHPLVRLRNCSVTPHQAWAGVLARERLIQGITKNIKSYISGTLVSL